MRWVFQVYTRWGISSLEGIQKGYENSFLLPSFTYPLSSKTWTTSHVCPSSTDLSNDMLSLFLYELLKASSRLPSRVRIPITDESGLGKGSFPTSDQLLPPSSVKEDKTREVEELLQRKKAIPLFESSGTTEGCNDVPSPEIRTLSIIVPSVRSLRSSPNLIKNS